MTRHDLDLFSLLSGIVLTAIALVALFGVTTGIAPWVWPTALIVMGGAVVLAALSSAARRGDATGDATTDPDRVTAMTAARAEVEQADLGASAGDPVAPDHTTD